MSTDIFFYDDDNSIPPKIYEQYRLVSCLKHTANKQVYLLAEIVSGKKVILKCASKEALELLETEYRFLMEHQFSFLPQALWGEKIGDQFYLIREYFEGETLESYVEKKVLLPTKEALTILHEIALCMEKLHSQNPPVLHRDVKPQNFIYTTDDSIKMIDMETAKLYNDSSDYDTVIIGTRKTAAPEQFGYHQSSIRTDIYGLGVLLTFLLTGDYSLKENNLASLPRSLRSIILKCTFFDPDKRYKTVADFRRDIRFFERFHLRAVVVRALAAFLLAGLLSVAGIFTYHCVQTQIARENSNIIFVNPKIEAAARNYLNKDADDPISAQELSQIKTLLITGDMFLTKWYNHTEYHGNHWFEFAAMEAPDEYFSLEDLRYFKGLEELALDLQNVEDLSGLEELPLKKISLMRNNITDVSVLAQIPTLEYIQLNNNPVESLAGFEKLTNLKSLYIMSTGVSDLTPIKDCPLTTLSCSYTNVTDYSFLSSLAFLESFITSHLTGETIQYINTLTSLRELTLIDSQIKSLTQLSNLKSLRSLDVTGCLLLENLDGVENFTKLDYLAFTSTNISDVTPIKGLPAIRTIELSYAPITDFTPLNECPLLDTMFINRDLAEIAQRDMPDKVINYIIVD